MPHRRWSDEEIIVAIYLYRFGFEELGLQYNKISEILGRTTDALFMKIGNLLSSDQNQGGLKNRSKRDIIIFSQFCNVPKDELRAKVINILIEKLQAV